jgi:Fungal specific transcription factor domain
LSGSGSSKTAKRESPGSSSDEYDEGAAPGPLEAIQDEDEDLHDVAQGPSISKLAPQRVANNPTFSGQKPTTRHSSEAPSLVQDGGDSPTPSTEGSVGYPAYQTAGIARMKISSVPSASSSDTLRSDWSHLPQDLQFYLAYFYQNLTHLHYSLKFDSGNFLRTRFLDAALRNEALLHAIVGFSAYQRTLHNPDGKINDFLQYYNKAVSLLLTSLKRGARHNSAMILAILQLATIEVRRLVAPKLF